jgi:hypothetical protein
VTALLVWVVLAQVQVTSTFDDGAIIGRVCDDTDGNGRCDEGEPGLAGVQVALETGLVSLTDALGRYHLAAVSARVPDASHGGRLLPGRHRLGVDPRWLPEGTTASPAAATLEVPMGALVLQDFALQRPHREAPALALGGATPTLSLAANHLEWTVQLSAVEGMTVTVRGRQVEGGLAVLDLEAGHHEVPVAALGAGRLELSVLPIDVVRRASSVLVIPRPLRRIGQLSVDAAGTVRGQLDGEARARVGAVEVRAGRPFQVPPGPVLFSLSHPLAGTWTEAVDRLRPHGAFALGLLDLEASFDPQRRQFHVAGRGAASGRASLLGFELAAEIDLRDTDVEQLTRGQTNELAQARSIAVFERQLELLQVPPTFGDASATVASNPSGGRFRAELSREGWGRLGYGSTRLFFSDGEIGRAYRALQGGFVDLKTPTDASPFGLELRAVAAPAQTDVVTGLGHRAAHERFESTGGSLFFLAHQSVVQGSEVLRVEWRDSVTGLALRELHLTRLRDYSLEATSGRVLLAQPLSFLASPSLLTTDPLSAGVQAVLVADYEYLVTDPGGAVLGGELRARAGAVNLVVGAEQDGAYRLLRGRADARIGPVELSAELARSQGVADGLLWSRDGGLTHLAPSSPAGLDPEGWAATLRARTGGLFNRGFWDLSGRFRDTGYEDLGGLGRLRQLSLRGEQPLGPVIVTALADLRDAPQPRDPFSGARLRGRLLGGGVGFEQPGWGVRLEARELSQIGTSAAGVEGPERGGLSLGLSGRYRLTPWLQLRAGFRQQLLEHGNTGFDDTFASVGADVTPVEGVTVGLRGGWGPVTGALAWGVISATRGAQTWYGAQSLDVDSPGASDRRLVTGVREQLDASTSVFAEDVSATDVDGLRLARAVGLTQRFDDALSLTARYERGARAVDGLVPEAVRDAGGLTAAWESSRLRLFARGEARVEQGRVAQYLANAGGELALLDTLTATVRVDFVHTSTGGHLGSRTLDAVAGLAWRFGAGALIGRYTFRRELLGGTELVQHLISVLPTVRLGDRFSLGAGGHLAVGPGSVLVSASLRPAVRLVAGLELAAEGALRSSAPDAGSLAALRGEVGYRFDHRFFLGAGYSVFGFSGTGIEAGATASTNRLSLRTEVAY